MLLALYFSIKPYFTGLDFTGPDAESIFKNLNSVLVFMGLGISFSTLQDTSKTQNKISKKIWESPKKGKIFILLLSLLTLFIIASGIAGYFSISDSKLKELSFGIIVVGIGLIGLLKSAIEMFEYHRKDRA
jgi:hypothetical protein